MLKVQYKTPEEREQILANNIGLYLIEEQNITEGNFLIFSDKPNEPIEVVVATKEEYNILDNRIKTLEDAILNKG